jgi:hypothetical protein
VKINFDIKSLVKKTIDFGIKHHIKLALIGAPIFGVLAFSGMVIYNQSASFCQKCHLNKGQYINLDLRILAHQGINKGGPTCLSCHVDKAVEMIYFRNAKKLFRFTERAANLSFQENVSAKDSYQDDECLSCHPDALDQKEVDQPNLPYEVANIGLRFDHRLHYRFEKFRQEDQIQWQRLSGAVNLTADQQQDLERLEKMRAGNCETCHSRIKTDADRKKYVDKTVNFAARNPMNCNGCHQEALPIQHPGMRMSFPSNEACSRCHHGKLHGKFQIFIAGCAVGDGQGREHCVKCHPGYTFEK